MDILKTGTDKQVPLLVYIPSTLVPISCCALCYVAAIAFPYILPFLLSNFKKKHINVQICR